MLHIIRILALCYYFMFVRVFIDTFLLFLQKSIISYRIVILSTIRIPNRYTTYEIHFMLFSWNYRFNTFHNFLQYSIFMFHHLRLITYLIEFFDFYEKFIIELKFYKNLYHLLLISTFMRINNANGNIRVGILFIIFPLFFNFTL